MTTQQQTEQPTEGILRSTKATLSALFNRMTRNEDGSVSPRKCITIGGIVVLILILPAIMFECLKWVTTCLVLYWLLKTFARPADVKIIDAEVLS